jgi:F-type H+-transporting ATPase subunit delta
MDNLIAEKYARALFEAALEQKTVESLGKELQTLKDLLNSQPEIKRLLAHPRLAASEKLAALEAVLPKKPTPVMGRFLGLMIGKKRAKHLPEVVDEFEKLQLASGGQALVRVVSASTLTPPQRDTLVKKVADVFGVKAILREEVRPDLVGGMILYLGDQRMDATVLGQLEKLKQSLLS